MDAKMDATSPLCMGCSAMLAWITSLFLHDIYPALTIFTALGGSILTCVGLWRLGHEVLTLLHRALTRGGSDT